MKKFIKVLKVSIFVAIVTIATSANAQTSFGPGGPGVATVNGGFGAPPNDVPGGSGVPFDGGLSLILLASGIGYGVKKLRKPTTTVA